jgi:hypothetical protein
MLTFPDAKSMYALWEAEMSTPWWFTLPLSALMRASICVSVVMPCVNAACTLSGWDCTLDAKEKAGRTSRDRNNNLS